MPQRRESKRRVVRSGSVVIRPLCRFEAGGGAKWSMHALVCAIPTMRISTVVLGKAVSNAGISGRHVIIKLMRKIGTFQIPVDSFPETSGGGRIVMLLRTLKIHH
jgi:hypothetical protein